MPGKKRAGAGLVPKLFPFRGFDKMQSGRPSSGRKRKEKTNLVAGGAARLELLGVVTLAVELLLVDAVSQVDQQFGTGGALEAGRMPGHVFAKLWSHDAERASRNVAFTTITLLKQKERERPKRQNKKTNRHSWVQPIFKFWRPFRRHLTDTCFNILTTPSILGAITFDKRN